MAKKKAAKKKVSKKMSKAVAGHRTKPPVDGLADEATAVSPAVAARVAGDAKAEETAAADVVAAKLEEAAPEALASILKEIRGLTLRLDRSEKENDELRATLAEANAGGHGIVSSKEVFELPTQEEVVDPSSFAVFRSPHPGFRQKLIRSKKKEYSNGDIEITAATFAEFEQGVCILTDEDLIVLMRKKEAENMKEGRPVFKEIQDDEQKEAARLGKLSDRSIVSSNESTPDLVGSMFA